MEDNKIYNDTITIEGIEMKNNRYIISAHNGKKYSFWAKKKDGSNSVPYSQFKSMEIEQGNTVYIGYVIEEFDTDYGRKQANKIINFREANESQATTPAPQPQKPHSEVPTHSQSNSDRDFDKENVGKCQSLFLQAYIQAGHSFSEAKLQVIQAKKLAEMVVYGYSETVAPDISDAAEDMAREEFYSDEPEPDGVE